MPHKRPRPGHHDHVVKHSRKASFGVLAICQANNVRDDERKHIELCRKTEEGGEGSSGWSFMYLNEDTLYSLSMCAWCFSYQKFISKRWRLYHHQLKESETDRAVAIKCSLIESHSNTSINKTNYLTSSSPTTHPYLQNHFIEQKQKSVRLCGSAEYLRAQQF